MITAQQKYGNAMRSAQQRGIDWQFTFESWMSWWGDDFGLRGPKADDLCMARNGDIGPYHSNNVSKKTNSENVREMRFRVGGNGGRINFTHSTETRAKMSIDRKGRKAWNKGLNKQQQLAYTASKGE